MLRASKQTITSPLEARTAFLQGNEACADGAVIAGCRFFAGYPITPSSEVMRRMCDRFGELEEGTFLQMEDEIGSIGAVIGASWAGAKAMTATSGPGFSLMQESIGYAIMTETPCVIVDIQRAGPSTGQATRPAQSDLQQARWGNHGGYPLIALCPSTAQEYLDLTVLAFNFAEALRVPVIVLGDEVIGHARERVIIEPTYEILQRYYAAGEPPFDTDHESAVPSMPRFGDGEKLLVTGSTHDAGGLRRASSPQVQQDLTARFTAKINRHRHAIVRVKRHRLDDADLVFIAFGATARTCAAVIARLREGGTRAGLLKLNTIWPVAEKAIGELDRPGMKLIVPEMNNGQFVREIQRIVRQAEVFSYTQQDGEAVAPGALLSFVMGVR